MNPVNQPVGYLNNIGDVTVTSFQNLWYKLLQFIPQLIGAIIILIIGLIIASIVGSIVKKIIQVTGIDHIVERSKLNERFKIGKNYSLLSGMIGAIVKWFIIIATLMSVADILNLPQITDFFKQILLYVPRAIVAVIILTIGMLAADFVANLILNGMKASKLPIHHKQTLSQVAKYAIIIFSIMAALTQLNVVPQLIEILFGGLVLAMALAFGLGGREEAARMLQSLRQEN